MKESGFKGDRIDNQCSFKLVGWEGRGQFQKTDCCGNVDIIPQKDRVTADPDPCRKALSGNRQLLTGQDCRDLMEPGRATGIGLPRDLRFNPGRSIASYRIDSEIRLMATVKKTFPAEWLLSRQSRTLSTCPYSLLYGSLRRNGYGLKRSSRFAR